MDYLTFALVVFVASVYLHRWLQRRVPDTTSTTTFLLTMVVGLGAGWVATEYSGSRALRQIREMVEGFPPTYAAEMQKMGHAALPDHPDPDDPRYLAMIDAQIRWERVNPSVADIYTMRKSPDGAIFFLVDSETDYDRSGQFDSDREERTTPGEEYEATPALTRAFSGEVSFDEAPTTDRWGSWVAAFVPLTNADGRIEAVLGVDYPAERWLEARTAARRQAMGMTLLFTVLISGFGSMNTILRADLRHRRASEARVSQLNAELERRVLERTSELEIAHQNLVAASHRAGMAEVATNILHNVGNVLNSVNVAATIVSEKVRSARLDRLGDLARLLRANEAKFEPVLAGDPQLREIPAYLESLQTHMETDRTVVLEELDHLQKHVDHIRVIVATQQDLAKGTVVHEEVHITELVDEALWINQHALNQSGIEVRRDYQVQPVVWLEQHKAIQILVNLVRNAQQSCAESGRPDKRITVRVSAVEDGTRIEVVDNGLGFDPEIHVRMFAHGFTTRKDGHGYGLHSSSLAAQDLGGTLSAASDGPGRGASFTLEIPNRTRRVGKKAVRHSA